MRLVRRKKEDQEKSHAKPTSRRHFSQKNTKATKTELLREGYDVSSAERKRRSEAQSFVGALRPMPSFASTKGSSLCPLRSSVEIPSVGEIQGHLCPPITRSTRPGLLTAGHQSPVTPLTLAALADVAKGGDGAKSALREIFVFTWH